MKIKKWTEMLIGLEMVKNGTHSRGLKKVRNFGVAHGMEESEINLMINKQLNWWRAQNSSALAG